MSVHAREEVMAIVCHDLRNPLQTIVAGAAALESLAGLKGAAPAAAIRRATERMRSLIQDLLDVNVIASDRLRIEPAVLDAARLCADVHAIAEPICAVKRQRFQCVLDDPRLRVLADRGRLSQVFSNLVGNAAKFTQEGGSISLRMGRAGDEALFEVADNGPGISPEDLPRIFDRFWQARRVRRGDGVGLGLPIVQGIVKSHGGRIWAESAVGGGTRFFFTLPLAP